MVWNRARSTSDGKWRTLDSRAIFRSTTTLSELHHGVLSDLLTGALGVGWEARGRRHSTRPRYEIAAVPEALMAEFSQRADQIDAHQRAAVAEFVAARGRHPTPVEQMRIRQVSTVATRPNKSHRSLAELTDTWRQRADPHVPIAGQVAFVTSLKGRNELPCLRAGDLDDAILADAARAVITDVADRHATYGRHNLLAETHRLLHGVRFATPADRIAVAEHIGDLAVDASVLLTPPSPHHVPAPFRRPDGTSRLHPASSMRYSTELIFAAEDRLLDAARSLDGPAVGVDVADAGRPGRRWTLSDDQAVAVERIATSRRRLDLLVGPAGTGKSAAMAGLRAVWETAHGPGSVVGLAPSAAAAEVLADELGIGTENTAKWLTEHRRLPGLVAQRDRLADHLARRVHPRSAAAHRFRQQLADLDRDIAARRLRPGQLVIVDEASLAGTLALDELAAAVGDAGAKVVLVGDWAQLSAIEAGGAFAMLAADRGGLAPQLVDVRRFEEQWERTASVELRAGRIAAIDAYDTHGRVAAGDRDVLLHQLFAAWKRDRQNGLNSLMIATDAVTVAELNALARADRLTEGTVEAGMVALSDGQEIGVGDEIVTRRNQRHLIAGRSWVKNGDRWHVTTVHANGSLVARRLGSDDAVLLPAGYASEHVELAYATTTHRAQGATVDTAHAFVSPTTTREALYVAATRGRSGNQLYVDTEYDPDPSTSHDGVAEAQTARDVLSRILANEGADLSAHDTIRRHRQHTESFATLAAEYQAIAQVAQAERFEDLLQRSGLTDVQVESVRTSVSWGSLTTALRDAEGRGFDISRGLRAAVIAGPLADAFDVAGVLHHRVDRWVSSANNTPVQVARNLLIAGLIPRAVGVTDPDLQRALEDRQQTMEERNVAPADAAIRQDETSVRHLRPCPTDPSAARRWKHTVTAIVGPRARWEVNGANPIGDQSAISVAQAQRQLFRQRDSSLDTPAQSEEHEPPPPLL